MGQNKLLVNTNLGDIIAYKSLDPNYPGIFLCFKPLGSDYEIDLAYAEVKEEENSNNVDVYEYRDCWKEDYTDKFSISKDEALKALNSTE